MEKATNITLTLWNIIRDFYVQYVFGGRLSNGDIVNINVGNLVTETNSSFLGQGSTFFVPISGFSSVNSQKVFYISFSDWLSTTSTIITLVVILVCIAFFIRWIFKVCSNAILLR